MQLAPPTVWPFSAKFRYFVQGEIEYLGSLLTPGGLEPQPKGVGAIRGVLCAALRRVAPTTLVGVGGVALT